MSTVLDQTEGLLELADIWEGDAEAQTRYDPNDPKAKVLARCAADLRRIVGEQAPEWVPIATVRAATGRSLKYLRARCEALVDRGHARQCPNGRWEMALEAALTVPKRSGSIDLSGATDMDDLARMLGRDR